MLPVTPAEFVEHPLSTSLKPVGVALGADTVTVVGEPPDALIAANRDSASFARLASTPVPAANPITAADRMAIMRDRVKTKTVHPNIRFDGLPGSDIAKVPYPEW